MRHSIAGNRHHRRGSTYLLVLGVSLIVTVIGLSAVTLTRIESRVMRSTVDEKEAEILAVAAVEHALTTITTAAEAAEGSGAAWRSLWSSGVPVREMPLGRGTITWQLVDEIDGDIDDDPDDPVRVHGIGRVGSASRSLTVMLVPIGQGLELLASAMLVGETLDNNGTITVSSGPITVNGSLDNVGWINGVVDAVDVIRQGNIAGVVNTPTPALPLPADGLFATYRDRATVIDWDDLAGTLDTPLLSAGVNPYGWESEEGVYYIHVPDGGELRLECKRIRATLVIRLGEDARLRVDDAMAWDPHSLDAPILIVKGSAEAEVRLMPTGGPIEESTVLANLNPPHTPYQGESDAVLDDTYAHLWKGLIHIVDTRTEVTLGGELTLNGTLVAAGSVEVASGSVSITVDPNLLANPPEGYTSGNLVSPVASSWRRAAVD